MTDSITKQPSRGRLFKLFTELGPYFRIKQSNESLFFFDCLEICLDVEKELEEREFYGWWVTIEKSESGYAYQRFDGLYNLAGDWVCKKISAENKKQLDQSFAVFFKQIATLLKNETGYELVEFEHSEA